MFRRRDDFKRGIWPWAAGLLWAAGCLQAQTLDVVLNTNLFEPYGVAVDGVNQYYITDSANNRILRLNPSTGAMTNLAGVAGAEGLGAEDDPNGQFARFFSPQGITVVNGGILVADSGNHVLRYVTFGGSVSTIAGDLANAPGKGTGVNNAGFQDGAALEAKFNAPSGLAWDGQRYVYVADSLNGRIRELDLETLTVRTVWSDLVRPSAVAVGETTNEIYVAETGKHSIKKITLDSQTRAASIELFAGSDSAFLSGMKDDPRAKQALFRSPRGLLWVGGKNGLLVADSGNGVVRRVFYNAIMGTNSVEVLPVTVGSGMVTPVGLGRDTTGTILIVDLDEDAIRGIRAAQLSQPPVRKPTIGYIEFVESDFFVGTMLRVVTNATFNNDVVVGILAEPGTETFYRMGPSEALETIPDPVEDDRSAPAYRNGQTFMPESILNPIQPDTTIKAISTQADRRPSEVVMARFRFQVSNPTILGNNPASLSMLTATDQAQIWYTTGPNDAATPDPTTNAPAKRYIPGTRINLARVDENVLLKVQGFRTGYSPSRIVKREFLTNDVFFNKIGIPTSFTAGVGSTIVVPVEVKMAPDEVLRSLQFRFEVAPLDGAPAASLSDLSKSASDFIPLTTPGGRFPNVAAYPNGLSYVFVGSDSDFFISDTATVALLGVQIPVTAAPNQRYSIAVRYPSGTSDGLQSGLLITNELVDRFIVVTNRSYLVGDTATARWYNSGDFGDGDLSNADVNAAFFASLGVRLPYPFTDAFDAMDAFPPDGNGVLGGDGQIRFLDWQTILNRALRLESANWRRSWSETGVRISSGGSLPGAPNSGAESTVVLADAWVRQATLDAGVIPFAEPGTVVRVPLYVQVAAGYEVNGLSFRALVLPEGNAPAWTAPLRFTPGPGIAKPLEGFGDPQHGLLCGWALGSFSSALRGRVFLGNLEFAVPAGAVQGQSYQVIFLGADGAADSRTQYDFETLPGAVWIRSEALRPKDQISPEWVNYFFGTATASSAEGADPDQDGVVNLAEYVAGTSPIAAGSHLRAVLVRRSGGGWAMQWPTVPGRRYTLETSSRVGAAWSEAATGVLGTGAAQEYILPQPNSISRFYRVRIER